MTTGNFLAAADWYAQLPSVFTAAGAFITAPDGRVLLVKPNYRDYWGLPGGICEHAEPPHLACAREVREELGLDLAIGALLVIDWVAPDGDRPDPIIYLLFDGGVLGDPAGIRLQHEELDGYEFVDPAEVAGYLPPFAAPRVPAALAARASGSAIYLPVPA